VATGSSEARRAVGQSIRGKVEYGKLLVYIPNTKLHRSPTSNFGDETYGQT